MADTSTVVDLREMASRTVAIIVENGRIRTAQPGVQIVPVETKGDEDTKSATKVSRWLRWAKSLKL